MPRYDQAFVFSEGLAAVKVDKKWGFIDKDGTLAIQPQFDETLAFRKGLAPVRVGHKWTYIDRTGRPIGSPRFENVGAVTEEVLLFMIVSGELK